VIRRRLRRSGDPSRPTAAVWRVPRLQRARTRASTVVAATTDLLGLSSTRRAALLAGVVCALALSVAVPLRNYVVQRQELAEVSAEQRALADEVQRLTRDRDRLADPEETEAQARTRLGYVTPGEIPFVVQLPGQPVDDRLARFRDAPWYLRLWSEVAGTAEDLPEVAPRGGRQ